MRGSAPATAGLSLSAVVSLYRLAGFGTGGIPGTVVTGACAPAPTGQQASFRARATPRAKLRRRPINCCGTDPSLVSVRLNARQLLAPRDGLPDGRYGLRHDRIHAELPQLGACAARIAGHPLAAPDLGFGAQAIEPDHPGIDREH